MDKHGYFSLATTSSYSEGMISKAKRIFVEVNDFQPRSLCNTQLHISQIDAIVENSHPLPVLPATKLDETSITIGNLIAEQIPDGACRRASPYTKIIARKRSGRKRELPPRTMQTDTMAQIETIGRTSPACANRRRMVLYK